MPLAASSRIRERLALGRRGVLSSERLLVVLCSGCWALVVVGEGGSDSGGIEEAIVRSGALSPDHVLSERGIMKG